MEDLQWGATAGGSAPLEELFHLSWSKWRCRCTKTITGSDVTYAGGGGGAFINAFSPGSITTVGLVGVGGGGNGGPGNKTGGTPGNVQGSANDGGGAGAGGTGGSPSPSNKSAGAAGFSGIVVVKENLVHTRFQVSGVWIFEEVYMELVGRMDRILT